jgi:hypothetical protein
MLSISAGALLLCYCTNVVQGVQPAALHNYNGQRLVNIGPTCLDLGALPVNRRADQYIEG